MVTKRQRDRAPRSEENNKGQGTNRQGWRRGARAQRKPLLSFRFSGSFLFRFADRVFSALFLKEPPRSTR